MILAVVAALFHVAPACPTPLQVLVHQNIQYQLALLAVVHLRFLYLQAHHPAAIQKVHHTAVLPVAAQQKAQVLVALLVAAGHTWSSIPPHQVLV